MNAVCRFVADSVVVGVASAVVITPEQCRIFFFYKRSTARGAHVNTDDGPAADTFFR